MSSENDLKKIVAIQGDKSGGDALGFLRFKREGSDDWEYVAKQGGGKWDWNDQSGDSKIINLTDHEFIVGIRTYVSTNISGSPVAIKGLAFDIYNRISKDTTVKFLKSGGIFDYTVDLSLIHI